MRRAFLAVAFMVISICSSSFAQESQSEDPVVAIINGQQIRSSDLNDHAIAAHLSFEEALEDMIDLRLLRAAAAAHKISVPAGILSPEVRADIEYQLAVAMALDVPPVRVIVIVDHAWLKDAEDEKLRATDRALIERLRTLVEGGLTIPEAYTQLNVDGTAWHTGDHEEYLTIVLPAEVHNLPAGSLSPIIPGDGGLHLFKIHKRTEERPARDEVRNPLLTRLRLDATIELPEPAATP